MVVVLYCIPRGHSGGGMASRLRGNLDARHPLVACFHDDLFLYHRLLIRRLWPCTPETDCALVDHANVYSYCKF